MIINDELLAWITSGMNFLKINPRTREHLILTNDIMESIDLELSAHPVVGINLIITLDKFLYLNKKILMLGKSGNIQIVKLGKELIGSMKGCGRGRIVLTYCKPNITDVSINISSDKEFLDQCFKTEFKNHGKEIDLQSPQIAISTNGSVL